ncbi:MAG: hypothetical protein AB7K09_13905 [Planctomycetota bacterium]
MTPTVTGIGGTDADAATGLAALPLGKTDQKVADLLLMSGRLDEASIDRAARETLARPSLSLVDALVVLDLLSLRDAQSVHDHALGKAQRGPFSAPPGANAPGTDWSASATGFRSMMNGMILSWISAGLWLVGSVIAASAVGTVIASVRSADSMMGALAAISDLSSSLGGAMIALWIAGLAMCVCDMCLLAGLATISRSIPAVGGLRAMATISTLFITPVLMLTIASGLAFSLFGLFGANPLAIRKYFALDLGTLGDMATAFSVVYGLAALGGLVGAVFFVMFLLRLGRVFGSLSVTRLVVQALIAMAVLIVGTPVAALLTGGMGSEVQTIVGISVLGVVLAVNVLWYLALRECYELVRVG